MIRRTRPGEWAVSRRARLAAGVAASGLALTACGNSESTSNEPGTESAVDGELIHVHDVLVGAGGSPVYLAAHTGLYELRDGEPVPRSDRFDDLMAAASSATARSSPPVTPTSRVKTCASRASRLSSDSSRARTGRCGRLGHCSVTLTSTRWSSPRGGCTERTRPRRGCWSATTGGRYGRRGPAMPNSLTSASTPQTRTAWQAQISIEV